MANLAETTAAHATGPLARLAGKYLTFTLADEAYGVPVLKVREIITMLPITSVPQMPRHVKGVINLRGKVIPGFFPLTTPRIRQGFSGAPTAHPAAGHLIHSLLVGAALPHLTPAAATPLRGHRG
jgi:hypothetical protein